MATVLLPRSLLALFTGNDFTDNVKALKSKAYGFLGIRYRFGGSSRSGIDCSSFVQQVFREMEVSLPRTAREQFAEGNEVPHGDLQKGDLVFFRTTSRGPSHVGIVIDDDQFIHAPSSKGVVRVERLSTDYWSKRFIAARRLN